MRAAFTLIELMVVMLMLVLVLGFVVPKGAKLLSSFENSLDSKKESHFISQSRSEAFLMAESKELNLTNKHVIINSKGVVFTHEKSNDNH